jgi:hypothetical protein
MGWEIKSDGIYHPPRKKSHGILFETICQDGHINIMPHPPHHDAASDTLNSRPTQQSTLLQLFYANQELVTKYFAVQTKFSPTNIAKNDWLIVAGLLTLF